jgi:hypothetical protein
MATSAFAALLFRPDDVPDRALSRGFAVALAGWDVPDPHLTIAQIPGPLGFAVAFYASGLGAEEEGFEHAVELFEDELSPAVGVIDAAVACGARSPVVLTLVYAEDVLHDEAWRVTPSGFERRFVREGEDGIERGIETEAGGEVVAVEVPGDDEAELERALRPHRGSSFLTSALGTPALAALMGALYAADRRVPVRFVDPDAGSIAEETRRLVRALGRVEGRGAAAAPTHMGDTPMPPAKVAGVAQPESYAAFARAYDWADPGDPGDLFRELALGAITGTLRFLRPDDIAALDASGRWSTAAARGLYPIAKLLPSALGSGGDEAVVALAPDGASLMVARGEPLDRITPAGTTLGELVLYLALGWSRRSSGDEDLIGALMLRARVRVEAATAHREAP